LPDGLELDHEELDGYPIALNFAARAYTVRRALKVRERVSGDEDEYE
jgi:hypothetical protein